MSFVVGGASAGGGGQDDKGAGGGRNGRCGGNRGWGGPCGACKFLRRKCMHGCIFAPYFDQDQGALNFATVHRVFGASNVSRLLANLPPENRSDAIITICYEAQARLHNPIYGCVYHIMALQQQVLNLQAELNLVQNQLIAMEQMEVAFPTQALQFPMPIPNIPSASNIHPNVNQSFVLDDQVAQQFSQQQYAPNMNFDSASDSGTGNTVNTIDLHALPREFINRGQFSQQFQQQPYVPVLMDTDSDGASENDTSNTVDTIDLHALAREFINRGLVGGTKPPPPCSPQ